MEGIKFASEKTISLENMTQWERDIAEHYGYTETANTTGCWQIDETTLERLKTLPEVLDPKRKIRITFDYDPDFPRALIQIWTGVKEYVEQYNK